MAYKRISPQPVVEGGTGAQTFTTHGVLVGEGTGAIVATAVGTTGQVLTGSTGADPVWASPAASSISITGDTGGALVGAAFTFTGGTTGLKFGGSGSTETVSGTLIVANGGTGAITLTSNGVLLGNTTSAITATAAGTTGQVLTGVTSSAPTWQSPAASSITITGNSGGGLTGNSFTFTGGTTGLTFAGAGTTETLGGDLVVANGGTGNTTFTAYSVITAGTTATGAFQNVSGLGSSGNVLTSNGAGALPTWQAASGSTPAITLISTKTASASSSVAWTSGISGTFNQYMLVFQGSTSAGVSLLVQFSTNGGSTYTTTGYVNLYAASTAGLAITNATASGAGFTNMCGTAYICNLTSGSGYITLNSTASSFTVGAVPAVFGIDTGGFYNTATITGVNALQIIPVSGTFSGTYSLYSVQS